VNVKEDGGTKEREFDQIRALTKAGNERSAKTIAKTAKGEVIVWLIHAKTRTQDNRSKTVTLSKRTISGVSFGGVRGGETERGDIGTGGQGGMEVTGKRDSSGEVLETSLLNRSPIFTKGGDGGPKDQELVRVVPREVLTGARGVPKGRWIQWDVLFVRVVGGRRRVLD